MSVRDISPQEVQGRSLIDELLARVGDAESDANRPAAAAHFMLKTIGGENMPEKPQKEFRAGSVRATIWEQKRTKDDREFVTQSVTVERRYKDDAANEWRSTNSFNTSDLPNIVVVVTKAYEFLTLKERDPAKE